MVRGATLTVLLLAGALTGSAAPASRATPETLVLAKGPIAAFAQDGGRIAWASTDPRKKCPWLVRIRILAAGRQYKVNAKAGPTCKSSTGFDLSHTTYLALAGQRALWTLQDTGNNTYVSVVTGAVSVKRDRQLEELVFSNSLGDGDHLGGLAGDGSTLVYGVARVGVEGPPDCDIEGTCRTVVAGGRVIRVAGATRRRIPAAPPPALLAAAGGRIALVVAGAGGLNLRPGQPPRVEVRNAVTGHLVGAFTPGGTPVALAASPTFVALLVRRPDGGRIERYSPGGALVGTTAVPLQTARVLSATSRRVVFRVGRSIRTLGVGTGTVTTIATAKATPIGLSIEGRRLAWAENVSIGGRLRGRIRALILPK